VGHPWSAGIAGNDGIAGNAEIAGIAGNAEIAVIAGIAMIEWAPGKLPLGDWAADGDAVRSSIRVDANDVALIGAEVAGAAGTRRCWVGEPLITGD